MTVEETAACALAVLARNEVLESPHSADFMGDHFPVDLWQARYSVALDTARKLEGSYSDPELRVHKIVPYVASVKIVRPS